MAFEFITDISSIDTHTLVAYVYNLALAYFYWDVSKFIFTSLFGRLRKWGVKS